MPKTRTNSLPGKWIKWVWQQTTQRYKGRNTEICNNTGELKIIRLTERNQALCGSHLQMAGDCKHGLRERKQTHLLEGRGTAKQSGRMLMLKGQKKTAAWERGIGSLARRYVCFKTYYAVAFKYVQLTMSSHISKA